MKDKNGTNKQPQSKGNKQTKPGTGASLLLYLHDLAYLIAIMMIVFLLVFRVVVVSGSSMKNTLVDGDYLLLLSNVFYKDPQPGDVIVASKDSFENGVPIVKRVIATEGQRVNIDFINSIVYVDGKPLDEGDYVSSLTNRSDGTAFPLTVPEGFVFVLGDNREDSCDSRNPQVGLIDKREILGKAIFLFLPGTDGGTVQRDLNRIRVMP